MGADSIIHPLTTVTIPAEHLKAFRETILNQPSVKKHPTQPTNTNLLSMFITIIINMVNG